MPTLKLGFVVVESGPWRVPANAAKRSPFQTDCRHRAIRSACSSPVILRLRAIGRGTWAGVSNLFAWFMCCGARNVPCEVADCKNAKTLSSPLSTTRLVRVSLLMTPAAIRSDERGCQISQAGSLNFRQPAPTSYRIWGSCRVAVCQFPDASGRCSGWCSPPRVSMTVA